MCESEKWKKGGERESINAEDVCVYLFCFRVCCLFCLIPTDLLLFDLLDLRSELHDFRRLLHGEIEHLFGGFQQQRGTQVLKRGRGRERGRGGRRRSGIVRRRCSGGSSSSRCRGERWDRWRRFVLFGHHCFDALNLLLLASPFFFCRCDLFLAGNRGRFVLC